MPNQLLVELYWGKVRQHARAFSSELQVFGAPDDRAAVPLWGFGLETPLRLAERTPEGWRVFTPSGAAVERSTRGDRFHRCADEGAFLLGERDAVRFSSGPMTLVASMHPATGWLPPRRMPAGLVFTLRLVALLLLGLGTFAWSAPSLDEALGEEPYGARGRAVRLLVYPAASWHCMLAAPPHPRPRLRNWGCRCGPPRPPKPTRVVGPVQAIASVGWQDRALINREINSHLRQVTACLKTVDSATVDWSIGRQGKVDWAHAKAKAWPPSEATRAAEKCLVAAVRGWRFPEHPGGPVRVTAPFSVHWLYLGRICLAPLGPCPCPD